MASSFELRRYQTAEGKVLVSEWLERLDKATAARIQAYVDRIKNGNFGISRSVGSGVSELKIDFGAGYRVYYLKDGPTVVILLCGGDKKSQQADIGKAIKYATDYWRRK